MFPRLISANIIRLKNNNFFWCDVIFFAGYHHQPEGVFGGGRADPPRPRTFFGIFFWTLCDCTKTYRLIYEASCKSFHLLQICPFPQIFLFDMIIILPTHSFTFKAIFFLARQRAQIQLPRKRWFFGPHKTKSSLGASLKNLWFLPSIPLLLLLYHRYIVLPSSYLIIVSILPPYLSTSNRTLTQNLVQLAQLIHDDRKGGRGSELQEQSDNKQEMLRYVEGVIEQARRCAECAVSNALMRPWLLWK